jgi:uncharacterized DUF497 family protein
MNRSASPIFDKHGMNFADLTPDFFLEAVVYPAKGNRSIAPGCLSDGTIAVIFPRLGSEGISVISMRPASVKERKLVI